MKRIFAIGVAWLLVVDTMSHGVDKWLIRSSTTRKSDADDLHHLAIAAQEAEDAGRDEEARATYEQILTLSKKGRGDPRLPLAAKFRLSLLAHRQGDPDTEQSLLNELLNDSLPDDLLLAGAILQAQLYQDKKDDVAAYSILSALEQRIPVSSWPPETKACYSKLKVSLNLRYRGLSDQGEKLFSAGLYREAAPLYQEVLDATLWGIYPDAKNRLGSDCKLEIAPRIRYRLAETLFLAKDYKAVVELLSNEERINSPFLAESPLKMRQIATNESYLFALALCRLGRYEEAITALRSYLRFGDAPLLKHYDEAQLELGLCHYHLHRLVQARRHLESLTNKHVSPNISVMARLYLARIDLEESSFKAAESALKTLTTELNANDPRQNEIGYLRGEISFRLQDYAKAAEWFEGILARQATPISEWVYSLRYHLGWSYLKIADDPLKGKSSQERYFSLAEEGFSSLVQESEVPSSLKEKAFLAQAQGRLLRGQRLQNSLWLEKADELLSNETPISSVAGRQQALLLRASASKDYLGKDKWYRCVTDEAFKDTTLYAQGWYLRGLNDLKEAQARQKKGEDGVDLFKSAAHCFERVFALVKDTHQSLAVEALKHEAQAENDLGSVEGELKAYSLLSTLLQNYHDAIMSSADPGEIYYLQGVVASKLGERKEAAQLRVNFLEIAEQSFHQIVNRFSDSPCVVSALQALGSLYLREGKHLPAQHVFLKLADDFSGHTEAGDALFWAAECGKMLGQESSIVQDYYQRAVKAHPDCLHGAEAYLMCYPFVDYLNGNAKALEHLQEMKDLFPTSPYLIHANYLLGLDLKQERPLEDGTVRKKDLLGAIDHFHRASKLHDNHVQKNTLPQNRISDFDSIRQQSLVERALALLAASEEVDGARKAVFLDYAAEAFQTLIDELEHSPDSVSSSYPTALPECRYGLAKVHVQQNEYDKAEQVLLQLIQHFASQGMEHGYWLSRARYDLAQVYLHRQDYRMALQHLQLAEEAAKGGHVLSVDQHLDLQLTQSECFRQLHDFDKAMALLSQVVNEDVASSLRVKAMYLRAELYQQQGRDDLAMRQLEATSKKGGEWGSRAKEKLESAYGLR